MDTKKIEFFLKEIAISLYTELSDDDKSTLGPNLETVMCMSPQTTLSCLNDLYDNLVACKRSIKQVEFYKEFSENEVYQRALQKLDQEVRQHIRCELQLKVCIDSNEEKLSQTLSRQNRNIETNTKVLERVKDENKRLKATLLSKTAELEEIKSEGQTCDEKQLSSMKTKAQKDQEKIEEYEKNIIKLKQKWAQTKLELENKNKEYEKHKREFVFLKKIIGASEDMRSTSKHTDKSDGSVKDGQEVKSYRTVKTPNRTADRSISPLPLSYNKKIAKYSKVTQSTKKLEKSPLAKILKSDLSKFKSKSKSRLPIFANAKK